MKPDIIFRAPHVPLACRWPGMRSHPVQQRVPVYLDAARGERRTTAQRLFTQ